MTSRPSIILHPNVKVIKHHRSNLREEIRENWWGETNSIFGLQYVKLVDGILQLRGPYEERTDPFCVEWSGVCTVNIDYDGEHYIHEYSGVTLSEREKVYIALYCDEIVVTEKEYLDREEKFILEEPWKYLEGLTPEKAIEKLTELGF
jgi:hypothetical protein